VNLRAEDVHWGTEGLKIVCGASVEANTGELVGLIGPNGSGKSSFLRCVYRVLKPHSGLVTLDGEDVWRLGARENARRTAVVLQEYPVEFEFTVREIVFMGRAPHKGAFDRDTKEDVRIVEDALERVGMLPFAERAFSTLSGGEKQRVFIARALAQQARLLVLDEPTNHLDVRHQLDVLELVRGLGVTTLAAIHDLNLAALYCDRLYAMQEGKIIAEAAPEEALTSSLVQELYGVDSEVTIHPSTGKPHVVFLPEGCRRDLVPGEPVKEGQSTPASRTLTPDYTQWLGRLSATYRSVAYCCSLRLRDRTLAESVSMEIVAEMLARPKVFHYFGYPFLGQLANLAEPRIAQALQEKQQGETSDKTTKGWQELFSRLLDVSREQQEVFVLAYVEGQPDTEIATALECGEDLARQWRADVLLLLQELSETVRLHS
jgi:iron complex transport system ATP-binding protein